MIAISILVRMSEAPIYIRVTRPNCFYPTALQIIDTLPVARASTAQQYVGSNVVTSEAIVLVLLLCARQEQVEVTTNRMRWRYACKPR